MGGIGSDRVVKRKMPVSFTPNPVNYNCLLHLGEGEKLKTADACVCAYAKGQRKDRFSSVSKRCDYGTRSETRLACRIVEMENANSRS